MQANKFNLYTCNMITTSTTKWKKKQKIIERNLSGLSMNFRKLEFTFKQNLNPTTTLIPVLDEIFIKT